MLALYPLPALSPSSLALALLRTPNGARLSHVDLLDTAESEPVAESTWSALRGDSVAIKEDLDSTELGFAVSQGAVRGELGLVAIVRREAPPILVVGPNLQRSSAVTFSL